MAALAAISNLYVYGPIIFLVIVPILYWFYKIDKQYPQVMAELSEREKIKNNLVTSQRLKFYMTAFGVSLNCNI